MCTGGFVSPAVRNLARELGVDPRGLLGRGEGGRVTSADVRAAAAPSTDERVPFDNIRKRTSVALLASKRIAAHASTVTVADYSSVEERRRRERLTGLAFVALAVVDALREYPLMNATVDADDGSTVHRAVHLGIAVDLDFKGLVVPVVHDADGLRLRAPRGRDSRCRGPGPRSPAHARRSRRWHVHDYEPRRVGYVDLGADHQPAPDRDSCD